MCPDCGVKKGQFKEKTCELVSGVGCAGVTDVSNRFDSIPGYC